MSTIINMKKTWQILLGEQIKAARKLRNLSQQDLARKVGSNRGSIIQFENGTGNPEFRVIAKIAAQLRADFNVLGCTIAAHGVLKPAEKAVKEQLELAFDQNHSFLANVVIRPTRKSMTITTHADYGIKSAS